MHHPILVYGLTGYGIFVAAALYLWQRLYLGNISVINYPPLTPFGEQLYTYNAAIAEMGKTAAALQRGIEAFDKDLARMKKQYDELKALLKAEKEAGQLPDERFIL